MKLTILLGLVLMADLFALLWIAVALVQEKWLFTSAPKDIQQKIQQHPERIPHQRWLGRRLLIMAAVIYVMTYIYGGYDGIIRGFSFADFFMRFLIMSYMLKAFDMVFFDWFLLTRSHFFQHYYPETEGCAGYSSFGFNIRQQLTMIALYPLLSALFSLICVVTANSIRQL